MKSGKHNSCIVYAWCECETVPQSQSLSTHTPVLDTARTHCSYCAAGQCETKQFTTLRQEKKKQENKNKKLIEQTQAFPLLRNGVSTEWMSASRNFYVLLPPPCFPCSSTTGSNGICIHLFRSVFIFAFVYEYVFLSILRGAQHSITFTKTLCAQAMRV